MKKNKLRIRDNELIFTGGLRISFQRTLRIPDDGKRYPLPPGLGRFPLRRVDDYLDRVPAAWREQGGVFLPMYQREAMWLLFHGSHAKPHAVKVGIGKVCAISGKSWCEKLRRKKQDYVVTPGQPWLDGIASGKGTIRQFVAMPLGMGYTVEGQVTGEERFGGVQIKVFEPKPGHIVSPRFNPLQEDGDWSLGGAAPPPSAAHCEESAFSVCQAAAPAPPASRSLRRRAGAAMGLAAGGKMKQKIYPDPHGVHVWDSKKTSRIFVHLVNSELWREITGEEAPATPVTAKSYAQHGLPFFDLYDEGVPTLGPSKKLAKVKSVKEMDEEKFGGPLQDDDPLPQSAVKKILYAMAKGVGVRDGKW